nr:helix-turn-helix transcriptional regulator [uncultured Chryseobacterium sp.]
MNDKKLKELRKNAKLTQQELAELVGVDRRSIISYEKGENIPMPIAKLLHIFLETDYLLKLESKEINYIKLKDDSTEIPAESVIENLREEILEKLDNISESIRGSSLIDKTYLRSIINHFDIKPKEIIEAENIEENVQIKKQ